MNRNRYRLIFDKRTGTLIPVAEFTASSKKGSGAGQGEGMGETTTPRWRRLAAMMALGMSVPLTVGAQNVVIDPSSGATVTQTANGVPLFNIVDPNASGLSHNKALDFNVGPQGLVFNNSLQDGVSEIGGYAMKNSHLSRQADGILVEVTGVNRSQLLGAMEVFGGKADLLIANENGLIVNDVSVINIDELLLTTGRYTGQGRAFEIHDGDIEVRGGGLSTDGLTHADLVARSMRLHGAISGSDDASVSLVAGRNDFDADTGGVTVRAEGGAAALSAADPTAFAIDGSAVAMHGRHIRMISTESGLGVRHEGVISAVGDIDISVDGDLRLRGLESGGHATLAGQDVSLGGADAPRTLSTWVDGTLRLDARGDLLLAGNHQAGDISIDVDGTLSSNGAVQAVHRTDGAVSSIDVRAGTVSLTGGAQWLAMDAARLAAGTMVLADGAKVTATDVGLTASGTLVNAGEVKAYDTLAVDARLLVNNGTLTGWSARVDAGRLDNTGVVQSDTDLDLTLGTGESVNEGVLNAWNALTLRGAQATLVNHRELSADVLLMDAQALVNHATGYLWARDIALRLARLDNAGELYGNNLDITAGWLRNAGGSASLYAAHSANIDVAGDFQNTDGATLQARHQMTIDVDGNLRNDDGAEIHVDALGGTLALRAGGDLDNTGGAMIHADGVDIDLDGDLRNEGRILGYDSLALAADAVDNAGVLYGGNVNVTTQGALTNRNDALIAAADRLRANIGGALDNAGSIAGYDIDANIAGNLLNHDGGRIQADNDLEASVGGDFTNTGTDSMVLGTVVDLDVAGAARNLDDALLQGIDALSLEAATLANRDARIMAGAVTPAGGLVLGNLTLSATDGDIVNDGQLLATGDVWIDAEGNLRNNAGAVIAADNLNASVGGDLLNADTAKIDAVGIARLDIDGTLDNAGRIAGHGVLIAADEALDNTGSITGGSWIAADTTALRNAESGSIEARYDVELSTETVANTGKIHSDAYTTLTIEKGLDLVLDDTVHNPTAGERLTLNADDVSIRRTLSNAGSIVVNATGDIDNIDGILTGKSFVATADGDFTNRSLTWAADDVDITAASLTNEGGAEIEAGRNLWLDIDGTLVNEAGARIAAAGNASIDAQALRNEVSYDGTNVRKASEVRGKGYFNDGAVAYDVWMGWDQASSGSLGQDSWVERDGLDILEADLTITAQGQIEAGGTLRINQDTKLDQDATVFNQGLIQAGGNLLINGDVDNQGVAASESIAAYLRRPVSFIVEAHAVNSAIGNDRNTFTNTFDFLDHFLDERWTARMGLNAYWHSSEVFKAMKTITNAQFNMVMSHILGADWKSTEYDTIIERWHTFKDEIEDRPGIEVVADRGPEIMAGGTVMHDGGHFRNTSGATYHENREITVMVGDEEVTTIAGHFDVMTNLRDLAQVIDPRQALDALTAENNKKFRPAQPRPDVQPIDWTRLPPPTGPVDVAAPPPPTYPLYETDIAFIDPSKYYGSDYFFRQIGFQTDRTVTVIGDNYFINELVTKQATSTVGGFFAAEHGVVGAELVQYLMDNAGVEGARLGLQVGVAPTAAQLAQLDHDIVWFVAMDVDGVTALVPQVFLSQATVTAVQADRAAGGATVAAGVDILVDADEGGVRNHNATMRAKRDVDIQSKGDVENISDNGVAGGGIKAGEYLIIEAKGELVPMTLDEVMARGVPTDIVEVPMTMEEVIAAGPYGEDVVVRVDEETGVVYIDDQAQTRIEEVEKDIRVDEETGIVYIGDEAQMRGTASVSNIGGTMQGQHVVIDTTGDFTDQVRMGYDKDGSLVVRQQSSIRGGGADPQPSATAVGDGTQANDTTATATANANAAVAQAVAVEGTAEPGGGKVGAMSAAPLAVATNATMQAAPVLTASKTATAEAAPVLIAGTMIAAEAAPILTASKTAAPQQPEVAAQAVAIGGGAALGKSGATAEAPLAVSASTTAEAVPVVATSKTEAAATLAPVSVPDPAPSGSVTIMAKGDINMSASDVRAANVRLQSEDGNVRIQDVHEVTSSFDFERTVDGMSKSVTRAEATSVGSTLRGAAEGGSLAIVAEKGNIELTGGSFGADRGLIKAGGDVITKTGRDYTFEETRITAEGIGVGARAGGLGAGVAVEDGPMGASSAVEKGTFENPDAAGGKSQSGLNSGKAVLGETAGASLGYQKIEIIETHKTIKNHNAQLEFGTSIDIEAGNTVDIGGADISARRGEGEDRVLGDVSISAAQIKSTKYVDEDHRTSEKKETFVGITTSVQSSVTDAVNNSKVLHEKTQQGMSVDAAGTAGQAVGEVSNLLQNDLIGNQINFAVQHSIEKSSDSTKAENINTITGNIKMKSKVGNIDLAGVMLDGAGGTVVLDSNRDINVRSAETTYEGSSSLESHQVTVGTSASVAPTGAGIGVSGGYNGELSDSRYGGTSHVNSAIVGSEVVIRSKGDTNIRGGNVVAGEVDLDIGRDLNIESVQDTYTSKSSRKTFGGSLGAEVNSNTLVSPTVSGDFGGGNSWENSTLTAEQSGITAGTINGRVGGNLTQKGSHLVAEDGGNLDVEGRHISEELRDNHEADGYFVSAGGGVSSRGPDSINFSVERDDRIDYESVQNNTVSGINVNARGGTQGTFSDDVDNMETVLKDKKIAGNSVSMTIGIGDIREQIDNRRRAPTGSGSADLPSTDSLRRDGDPLSTYERVPDARSLDGVDDGARDFRREAQDLLDARALPRDGLDEGSGDFRREAQDLLDARQPRAAMPEQGAAPDRTQPVAPVEGDLRLDAQAPAPRDGDRLVTFERGARLSPGVGGIVPGDRIQDMGDGLVLMRNEDGQLTNRTVEKETGPDGVERYRETGMVSTINGRPATQANLDTLFETNDVERPTSILVDPNDPSPGDRRTLVVPKPDYDDGARMSPRNDASDITPAPPAAENAGSSLDDAAGGAAPLAPRGEPNRDLGTLRWESMEMETAGTYRRSVDFDFPGKVVRPHPTDAGETQRRPVDSEVFDTIDDADIVDVDIQTTPVPPTMPPRARTPQEQANAFVEAARNDNPTFSRFKESSLETVARALRDGADAARVRELADAVPSQKWEKYPSARQALHDVVTGATPSQPGSDPDDSDKKGYMLVPRLGDDHNITDILVKLAATRILDGKEPLPIILTSPEDAATFDARMAELHKWYESELQHPEKFDDEMLAKMTAAYEASAPGRIPAIDDTVDKLVAQLDPDADKLYLLGHGNPGQDGILYNGGVPFTSRQMATQLKYAGLDPAFRDVRLFACEGGCPAADGGPSSGQQLADALQRVGFDDVEVSAYPGRIEAYGDRLEDGKFHRTVLMGPDRTPVQASKVRERFRPGAGNDAPQPVTPPGNGGYDAIPADSGTDRGSSMDGESGGGDDSGHDTLPERPDLTRRDSVDSEVFDSIDEDVIPVKGNDGTLDVDSDGRKIAEGGVEATARRSVLRDSDESGYDSDSSHEADVGTDSSSASSHKQGHIVVPRVGDDVAEMALNEAAMRMSNGKDPLPMLFANADELARFNRLVTEARAKVEKALSEPQTLDKDELERFQLNYEASEPGRIPVGLVSALKDVKRGEAKVYVMGHGVVAGEGIRYNRDGETLTLTGDEIAQMFVDAGLDSDFDDFHLYSCNGACPGRYSPSAGERLVETLGLKGFKNAEVSAYPGLLKAYGPRGEDGKHHRVVLMGPDNTPVQASKVRETFRYVEGGDGDAAGRWRPGTVEPPTGPVLAETLRALAKQDHKSFSRFKESALEPMLKALEGGEDIDRVRSLAMAITPDKWHRYPTVRDAWLGFLARDSAWREDSAAGARPSEASPASTQSLDSVGGGHEPVHHPDDGIDESATERTVAPPIEQTPQPESDGSDPADDAHKESYILMPMFGDDTVEMALHHAGSRIRQGKEPRPLIFTSAEEVASFNAGLAARRTQLELDLAGKNRKTVSAAKIDAMKAQYEASAPGRMPVFDERQLGNLDPKESKLYIAGHSYEGGNGVSFRDGAGWTTASNRNLADTLKESGLDPEFEDIRMYTCWSACRPHGAEPANAEKLAHALGKVGFENVKVSGYPGMVTQHVVPFPDGKLHFGTQVNFGLGKMDVPSSRVRETFAYNPELKIPPPRQQRLAPKERAKALVDAARWDNFTFSWFKESSLKPLFKAIRSGESTQRIVELVREVPDQKWVKYRQLRAELRRMLEVDRQWRHYEESTAP